MTTLTMERINSLTAKRAEFYRTALNGGGGAGVRQRIKSLTAELGELWDRRREERVGKLEGIDLLVERSYAQLYGSNYQDAVAPPSVSEAEDEVVALVA
ncbi:MAG: hypothetical protein IIB87_07600 [Chloroflexi bacterium]|nr:hypothetical protein [Chloroflexota bacterium]